MFSASVDVIQGLFIFPRRQIINHGEMLTRERSHSIASATLLGHFSKLGRVCDGVCIFSDYMPAFGRDWNVVLDDSNVHPSPLA